MQRFGLRDSALGRPHQRLPDWLTKWAALILEFVEHERQLLPAQLLALQLRARYTPLAAAAEAKGATLDWHAWLRLCPYCVSYAATFDVPVGVSDNRLQNVAITLDKVKLCLQRPGDISFISDVGLTSIVPYSASCCLI